jgi:hypothetical protein
MAIDRPFRAFFELHFLFPRPAEEFLDPIFSSAEGSN